MLELRYSVSLRWLRASQRPDACRELRDYFNGYIRGSAFGHLRWQRRERCAPDDALLRGWSESPTTARLYIGHCQIMHHGALAVLTPHVSQRTRGHSIDLVLEEVEVTPSHPPDT
jgi:hypothetical protein